ncbi:nucleoside monophosphate kinase [Patescibacteria group bacterium]|nr:nucleoside monophosphate kinase [Patescibacteria group bacterium]
MTQQKPIIILLGPQGSGKGTQAKKIANKLDIQYLEAGKLLRNEIASGSERGIYISSLINKGTLLPDEYISKFMEEKITLAVKESNGIIVDGFPRRQGQADAFEKIIKPTHVILIDISDEESMNRLMLRAKIENRIDDTEERIKHRLEQYHSDTEPLINRYDKQGILHRIDGTPDIPEVEKSISKIFE